MIEQRSRQIRVQLPSFREGQLPQENPHEPNAWFAWQFPEAAQRFGAAFLVGMYRDADGLTHTRPLELNFDFFAAALGGDRRLGHRVTYYPAEDSFWFYDPTMDAFCSTTEGKLEALMSNLLIRCAEDCNSLVHIEPLFTDFRKPKIFRAVIERAKSLLTADKSFFHGEGGHKRMLEGKIIHPTSKPVHEMFIEEALVPEPDGAITVTDCYHTFYRYCRSAGSVPPTRKEFQAVVTEAIRAAFSISLRHDVPAKNGKQTNGWKGITLRRPELLNSAGSN